MRDLLEALEAEDASVRVRAIEEGAARLAAAVDERDVEPITCALVRCASHPRAKVRQAVAEAAVHLPEAAFGDVIGRLLQDANAFVKRAATRSYDERSRRRRVARDCEERSADVLRLRARIGKTYGAGALRIADRISDRAVGQFVDRLLHEIVKVATPLRGAMADVRAEARAATGDRARLAARADDAHGMLELLIGIAVSARSPAQLAEPTYREVSVRALVDEQLALLRGRIGEARLRRLRVDVDVDAEIMIEADRVLLAQAFSNLLQNAVEAYAIEAEGEEGAIVIHVRAEHRKADTLVAVTIEDRGRGIAGQDLAHVGEPFVSSKGGGRGLGVLNVRRMIEVAHGGSLEIESELGVGTRMTVVLPRKQTDRNVATRG